MANEQQLDLPDPEVIRQQMEQTRSALTDKLEVLEQKVTDTVQGAATAVSDTVETVKESMEATVDSVKDTLNLRLQVERHPWLMVGTSAATGFVAGLLLGPSSGHKSSSNGWAASEPTDQSRFSSASISEPLGAQKSTASQPSWWHGLVEKLGPNIDQLKSLAIGVVGGVVRDLVAANASESLRPYLTERIDDMTKGLGGDVIQGSVLGGSGQEQESSTAARFSQNS